MPRIGDKVWIVVRENGEHHTMEREPLEGMAKWAAGQRITVFEFTFARVVHEPPKRRQQAAR